MQSTRIKFRNLFTNVAIIGNIGVGKSYSLNKIKAKLEELTKVEIKSFPEPVEVWTAYGPKKENCLKKMYKNKKQESFYFQVMAAVTKANQLQEIQTPSINLIERTFDCQAQIFIPSLRKNELLTEREEILLQDLLGTYKKQEQNKVDVFVFLKCSLETSILRIQKRGREGEDCVDIEYLKELDKLHEDWIKKLVEQNIPVFSFQTDDGLDREKLEQMCAQIIFMHNKKS